MAILKKCLSEVVEHLEKTIRDSEDAIRIEISQGYHLRHYPDRNAFFSELCTVKHEASGKSCFEVAVQMMCKAYITCLKESRKGRDKFMKLQLSWMDFLHTLLHNPEKTSETMQLSLVFKNSSFPCKPSNSTVTAAISRSVFNVLQQKVAMFKETASASQLELKESDLVQESLDYVRR